MPDPQGEKAACREKEQPAKRLKKRKNNKNPEKLQQLPDGQNETKGRIFQQKSTFVKMMLEDFAKADGFGSKKLSYFRLELYKLYATQTEPSNQKVENPVESVEFHTKKRL